MTLRPRATISLLLLLAAAGAGAAPQRPGPGGRFGGPPGGPGRGPDEMRKSLSLFFVHRARVELGLTDEQSLKLLPLVEKVEQLRQESGRRRGEIARQLEALADQASAKDEEVQVLVRSLDQEEERARGEQAKVRDEMMLLLTTQQKARFVLFAHRFRGAVEDQVRAMRWGRRGGPGPEGGDGDDREPPPVPPGP